MLHQVSCPGSEKSAEGKAMKYIMITRVGEGVLAGWDQLEAGREGKLLGT